MPHGCRNSIGWNLWWYYDYHILWFWLQDWVGIRYRASTYWFGVYEFKYSWDILLVRLRHFSLLSGFILWSRLCDARFHSFHPMGLLLRICNRRLICEYQSCILHLICSCCRHASFGSFSVLSFYANDQAAWANFSKSGSLRHMLQDTLLLRNISLY